ncbi:hypothetical protein LOTGIDRAFT_131973 [Lottia gigantea]|uniref:Uncharacterized protein n=1 Tax=Lottia gigantea TaxID=225164 RepID=V3ZJY1_LOTGI|nr:hypothetical protein LOTGIDRAFT_131973 [Lottia gigantea]ESO84552.1 hypothetical protein LOTGIDRAFT_131973 [Lottia gigantea]
MESHRDNKRYAHWNLEDTAQLIHSKFPGSTVLVIKPSKMHLKTFSVYNNFVESNDFGCPSHSTEYGAISNLSKLYQNILSLSDAGPHPLSLIGFSKGCVVLNQIVHELVGLDTLDKESNEFVKRIQQFYWLDGGHSGGKNTWVTDGSSLTALAQLNCDIHVHVTPYQVKDAMRSWIGREEKKFVNTLKRLGANLSHVLHFESEERCIENHFKVLQEFR